MRKLTVVVVAMLVASPAFAQWGTASNPNSHGTRGYNAPSGTYVQPHQQTNPNATQYDNYSTKGNTNPYTGQVGTKTPKW